MSESLGPELGVTVLLPVHGDGRFLRSAIESVLAQECSEPLEVLIVCDRPDPSAVAVIDSVAGATVRVIQADGAGLVPALNTGLREARYDLIARMDADDEMLPGRLNEQAAFLRRVPTVLGVGGQILFIDEVGAGIGVRRFPTDAASIRANMPVRNQFAHPAMMLRRSAALEAGGYRSDCTGAEDYDLWLRLLDQGDLTNLASDVLRYRLHGGQITSAKHLMVAEATYLAQWAAERRARLLTDRPLPWIAGVAPESARMRLRRGQVRAFARCVSLATGARGSTRLLRIAAAAIGMLLLRPQRAFRLMSLARTQGYANA